MSITDWLYPKGQHTTSGRTTTMTDPVSPAPEPAPNPRTDPRGTWSTAPDSEWLSEWAMIALSVGRVEMGYELARLARAALRCERHLGADAPSGPAPEPIQAAPEGLPPAADATALLSAVGQARPEPTVVPSGRCNVPIGPTGRLCHGVAFYDLSKDRWIHLDREIEQDHQANVPRPVYGAYDQNGGNGTV